MNQPRKRDEEKENYDTLFDLMFESEKLNIDQINVALKEYGVDPGKVEKNGLEFINRLTYELIRDSAKEKQRKFKELMDRFFESANGKERRKLIEDLFVSTFNEGKLVFNRNLERISDDYLESLSNDKSLLELWEKLNDKDLKD